MSGKAFYESLPQKRMGAGCVFFNSKSEVLLLKPSHKDGWEIPGGVVEDDESPKSCAEREVLEEMGLEVAVQKLLVIDYNSYPKETHKTEALMFIFDGGVLSDDQLSIIKLDKEEISDWMFFSLDNLPQEMNHSLRNRVIRAVEQKNRGGCAYLENQEMV